MFFVVVTKSHFVRFYQLELAGILYKDISKNHNDSLPMCTCDLVQTNFKMGILLDANSLFLQDVINDRPCYSARCSYS